MRACVCECVGVVYSVNIFSAVVGLEIITIIIYTYSTHTLTGTNDYFLTGTLLIVYTALLCFSCVLFAWCIICTCTKFAIILTLVITIL